LKFAEQSFKIPYLSKNSYGETRKSPAISVKSWQSGGVLADFGSNFQAFQLIILGKPIFVDIVRLCVPNFNNKIRYGKFKRANKGFLDVIPLAAGASINAQNFKGAKKMTSSFCNATQ
jgi:hypothetical protein